jgi:hypothetical protein
MQIERFLKTGDFVEPVNASSTTDRILLEISQLYRDRFQALQRQDFIMMDLLTQEIEDLRARLNQL